MTGAVFGYPFLRSLGSDDGLPLCVRVLMLAAERVDSEGNAYFNGEELRKLLAYPGDPPEGRPEGSAHRAVAEASRRMYVRQDSGLTVVRLHRPKVWRTGE